MKKALGIEFYRNYIGIEKPLRVTNKHITADLGYCDNEELMPLFTDQFQDYYENCKPHLKLPEDLTDKEWYYIVYGETMHKWTSVKRVKDNRDFIEIEHHINGWKSYCFIKNSFSSCNQEILNRMYSLHSHPKAKEYIENGLAIKKELEK